jgi:hypothetical protein
MPMGVMMASANFAVPPANIYKLWCAALEPSMSASNADARSWFGEGSRQSLYSQNGQDGLVWENGDYGEFSDEFAEGPSLTTL